MATFESYKRRITAAMKDSGIYNKNISIQVENLATSLYLLSVCREKMEEEGFNIVEIKKTRDGEQPVENPVLKTLSRVQADITRQMRQLKLTVEDIVGEPEQENGIDKARLELNNIKL